MDDINQYHQIAAATIARVFLGILFFFQGYDSVFKVKIKNVIETYQNSFTQNGIPKYFTSIAVWFTSCTALIGGMLLIIGLYQYTALYLLGLNLLITAVGFGMNTAMWDTKFVFPRLILIIFLLAIPPTWNCLSVDTLFFLPDIKLNTIPKP